MEKKNNSQNSKTLNIHSGFTKVPARVLNGLVTAQLTELDLRILLLVCRLSYGCLNHHWSNFLLKDLVTIGIAENHASEAVSKLIHIGWLVRNPLNKQEYRINEEMLQEEVDVRERHTKTTKISSLIRKNLIRETSEESNTNTPGKGGNNLPKQEVTTSQNGTSSSLEPGSAIDSDSKYSSIDNQIETEISSKGGLFSKEILDPETFVVRTERDEKTIETWRTLEPNNKVAFGYYYSTIVKKKVPFEVIDELVYEITQRTDIQNPGRYFVAQVEKYLKNWKEFEEEEELF